MVHKWNVDVDDATNATKKGIIVIYHGFLAHGRYPTVRYAAEFLAEANYAVIAVDLPGHGQSPGLRGYLPSADTVIEDGKVICQQARSIVGAGKPDESNNLKLFLVGSSMGGAIALSVAQTLGTDVVSGVILLAPMLKLDVSGIEHGLLTTAAWIVPTVELIPSSATSADKQYRDEAKREECENDALTVSGSKLRVGSALSCVDITLKIRERFDTIQVPFLVLVADEDVVVKNEGSEDLMAKSPSSDKTMKRYPALHGLLCEPSPLFDEIKTDILTWLEQRV